MNGEGQERDERNRGSGEPSKGWEEFLHGTTVVFACLVLAGAHGARAQQTAEGEKLDRRILGIIPSYRSSPRPEHYEPLTSEEKFKIAANDAFDRGTVVLGAALGAEGQLSRANPSFGNGVGGYGRYFATAYTDYMAGDLMTEGVFPVLLHEDPRYFRKGRGSGLGRLLYAIGQTVWTESDSGRGRINYSELAGNATAVAISNAYYPENRNAGEALQKWGIQIGVDMASNVMREFWPDIHDRLRRRQGGMP